LPNIYCFPFKKYFSQNTFFLSTTLHLQLSREENLSSPPLFLEVEQSPLKSATSTPFTTPAKLGTEKTESVGSKSPEYKTPSASPLREDVEKLKELGLSPEKPKIIDEPKAVVSELKLNEVKQPEDKTEDKEDEELVNKPDNKLVENKSDLLAISTKPSPLKVTDVVPEKKAKNTNKKPTQATDKKPARANKSTPPKQSAAKTAKIAKEADKTIVTKQLASKHSPVKSIKTAKETDNATAKEPKSKAVVVATPEQKIEVVSVAIPSTDQEVTPIKMDVTPVIMDETTKENKADAKNKIELPKILPIKLTTKDDKKVNDINVTLIPIVAETPEVLKQKESHLLSLGLLTHQAADQAKIEKQKRKELLAKKTASGAHGKHGKGQKSSAEYTGTLKTVIKLNRQKEEKRKAREPLKMTFQKGKVKPTGDKHSNGEGKSVENTFYTIQNEVNSNWSLWKKIELIVFYFSLRPMFLEKTAIHMVGKVEKLIIVLIYLVRGLTYIIINNY
jgi:hypothetical protein